MYLLHYYFLGSFELCRVFGRWVKNWRRLGWFISQFCGLFFLGFGYLLFWSRWVPMESLLRGLWRLRCQSWFRYLIWFFFGCQICLFLASIWIYMVDRSYNCDYKKVFVPPITILHFFMFWWLQYIYIYKCVFFSLIYCVLGGAMKFCRRKWMLFFMVKVRFFLFWQIQELVRGAKNAVSLAQVCFSISQRSCCYVVLYLYGEMVSGVFSFSNV